MFLYESHIYGIDWQLLSENIFQFAAIGITIFTAIAGIRLLRKRYGCESRGKSSEKGMKKVSILYLILAILSFVGFLLTVAVSVFICSHNYWLQLGFAALPTVIFSIFYGKSRQGIYDNRVSIILSIVLALVFLAAGIFNGIGMVASDFLTETRDIKQYKKVIRQYGYPDGYIGFFPEDIPREAENWEFYENPQFLQGGSHLYLKAVYEKKEYDKIVKKISAEAEKTVSFSDEADCREALEDNFLIQDGYYLPNSFLELFQLEQAEGKWDYYIYTNNQLCDEMDWNHGELAGVIANEKLHLIIYYYEKW